MRASRAPWPAFLLAAALAGCAPAAVGPRPVTDVPDARYRAALAGRTALARGLEAEVRIWSRIDGRRLPGARGRLLVAGPDAVRLRIQGALGAALDGVVRGDSLVMLVPSRRQAVEAAALGESLGVRAPGALLVSVLAAAWTDSTGAGDGSARAAGLAIDARGLPQRAAWRAPDGRTITVDYVQWTWVRGIAWPAHWKMTSEAGNLELECRLDRIAAIERVAPARLVIDVPPGLERVGPSALAEAWRVEER